MSKLTDYWNGPGEPNPPYDMTPEVFDMVVRIAMDNPVGPRLHKPSLGPYTEANPCYCEHCGKLRILWSSTNEECPV